MRKIWDIFGTHRTGSPLNQQIQLEKSWIEWSPPFFCVFWLEGAWPQWLIVSLLLVWQSINPSIHPSIHPSLHPLPRQVSNWSSQGFSSISTPLLRKNKGWWQITRGQGEPTHSPSHMYAYSVPTRLLVGFAMSCICILGSRRMLMQMQTVLIIIKGHLPLRVFPSSSWSFHHFLLTSLSLAPCQSFFPCCLSHSTFPILYNLQTADFGVIIVLFEQAEY